MQAQEYIWVPTCLTIYILSENEKKFSNFKIQINERGVGNYTTVLVKHDVWTTHQGL